jgi:hypothetical protein
VRAAGYELASGAKLDEIALGLRVCVINAAPDLLIRMLCSLPDGELGPGGTGVAVVYGDNIVLDRRAV